MKNESEWEMVKRHVRESEAHVARQKEIIEELRQDGHSVLAAERLLRTFEATLASHRQHLEYARQEIVDL